MRCHGLSFDVSVQPTDKCWATVWCKSRWIPLEPTDFLPIYNDVTETMIFPFRFTLDLFPVFQNSVTFHCVQKQPGPDLDFICISWKQLFQMELHWIYNCINKSRIWSIPREIFPGHFCVRKTPAVVIRCFVSDFNGEIPSKSWTGALSLSCLAHSRSRSPSFPQKISQ